MWQDGEVTAVPTARQRARAELTREITAEARRQLAAEGAAALSLRAVARSLGMASSAVYRYFPSRDELLTALIVEAYDSLGEAAEAADAATGTTDALVRWRAVGHAIRRWALGHPHEYALVYGSPVPGYRAPQLTVGPASRVTTVMAAVLTGASGGTAVGDAPDQSPEGPVALAPEAAGAMAGVPGEVVLRALMAWAQVFGLVSFELFGHFVGVVEDPEALFDAALDRIATFVGLVGRAAEAAGSRSPAPPDR